MQIQIQRARHRPRADPKGEQGGESITRAAVVVNVLLVVVKLVAGLLGNSAALVADAGHSLSDLVSDGVTLWALRIARIPPDVDHPYGHGRFEAVGALAVSSLVMAAGFGIGIEGWSLLCKLFRETINGCSAFAPCSPGPGSLALAACLISIVAKELLYRATALVARRLNSQILQANAEHHRSDVWSSVVALFGVAGAFLGLPWLDPLAACAVGIMVLNMGFGGVADAVGQLTDTTDEDVVRTVERAARSVPCVLSVSGVRARAMGSSWLAEVTVIPNMYVITASAAEHLGALVQKAVLKAVPDTTECSVRVRSCSRRELSRLPTPLQIDGQVKCAMLRVPEIQGVTRTMTHFEEGAPWVEVWIEVAPTLSVSDCKRVAQDAHTELLASEPHIAKAEFHLALPLAEGSKDRRP